MMQGSEYKINLTKIIGEGEFPCPSCGEIISPDDESRIIYEILDVKTNEDNLLEEILVLCKKCGIMIRLEGFEMLKEIKNELFDCDDYLLKGNIETNLLSNIH